MKEIFFSNFALYSKGRHFSITRFDKLIFCNMHTTSGNEFWKFVFKIIVFHKVLTKSFLNLNLNKNSEKNNEIAYSTARK